MLHQNLCEVVLPSHPHARHPPFRPGSAVWCSHEGRLELGGIHLVLVRHLRMGPLVKPWDDRQRRMPLKPWDDGTPSVILREGGGSIRLLFPDGPPGQAGRRRKWHQCQSSSGEECNGADPGISRLFWFRWGSFQANISSALVTVAALMSHWVRMSFSSASLILF
jgi:hypothetical protein